MDHNRFQFIPELLKKSPANKCTLLSHIWGQANSFFFVVDVFPVLAVSRFSPLSNVSSMQCEPEGIKQVQTRVNLFRTKRKEQRRLKNGVLISRHRNESTVRAREKAVQGLGKVHGTNILHTARIGMSMCGTCAMEII